MYLYLVVQMIKDLPAVKEMCIQSLSWEDPLEKGMTTNSYSCLEYSMDRKAWWATVYGAQKESDTTE